MTSISKNGYIDKLDDVVRKYNNEMHRAIKMKPIVVKDNTYNDFGKEIDDENPKFKVGDYMRILKFKRIFAKGYTPNCSEKTLMIKKIQFHGHMSLMILMVKKLLKHFMKNCER